MGQGGSRQTNKEVDEITQVRGNDGMNQGNMGEWQEVVGSGYAVNDKQLKGFADVLKIGCKRKIGVRDYTEILTLSKLKK